MNARDTAGRGIAPTRLSRRDATRLTGTAGVAALLGLAGRRPAAADEATETRELVDRVAAALAAAVTTGDTSAMADVFAADYVNHTPRPDLTTGQPTSGDLEGLLLHLDQMRAALEDPAFTVDDVIEDGEEAAVRFTFQSRVREAVPALGLAAGQRLEMSGVMIGRVEDGKVAESWDYSSLPMSCPAAADGATPEAAMAGDRIDVTLGGPGGEFAVAIDRTEFAAGVPYRFTVTNRGSVPHEFMIVPPMAPGSRSMAAMDELSLAHIAAADLPPGATATLDATFPPPAALWEWEFACYVPGHYESGMHIPIAVDARPHA